jgi:hypothetical protein
VRVGVVVAAAVLFTTFPLNYEIASGELVARSGLMRWRVPLDAIQEVSPSRNPASAPAWSLDRLASSTEGRLDAHALRLARGQGGVPARPRRRRRRGSNYAATAPCVSVKIEPGRGARAGACQARARDYFSPFSDSGARVC